jgi:hypothetical protein
LDLTFFRHIVCKYFLPFCTCPFILLLLSFFVQRFSVYSSPTYLFLLLLSMFLMSYSKNHCRDQCQETFSLFFCRSFKLTLKSFLNIYFLLAYMHCALKFLIHFKLILCKGQFAFLSFSFLFLNSVGD